MDSQQPIPDEVIIELCDADAKWGPLLFLRPSKEQRITLMRLLWMALVPGLLFGLFGNLLLELAARALEAQPNSPYAFPLSLVALYFFVSWLLVAPAWNRRAARLERVRRFRSE